MLPILAIVLFHELLNSRFFLEIIYFSVFSFSIFQINLGALEDLKQDVLHVQESEAFNKSLFVKV